MSKIFISYSSQDKPFATKLSQDLIELGHTIWLDEWEIKVGESIPSKISKGLEECDYVAVILSKSSIESKWVETEWQTKYWDEINESKVHILPLLIEKCAIPNLLKTKKYANFTSNYALGLVQLTSSISPVIPDNPDFAEISKRNDSLPSSISTLVEKAHSVTLNLSHTIAEALSFAIQNNYKSLEVFCRMELKGWHKIANEKIPDHRLREVFLSPKGDINLAYFAWNENPGAMFEYMRQNKDDFFPRKMGFPDTISEIEKLAANYSPTGVYSITMPLNHFTKGTKNPESQLRIYIPGNNYVGLLESVRKAFVSELLDLLPTI